MSRPEPRVSLSLISHTNVGKTTLARTLLRRDVGEVLDQAHVTDQSERFTLLESDTGARLELWDTPGFGDSARLLKRLEGRSNPVGWLLAQVWDRFANRPLWCSQQAAQNVRDEADVVLYLVNAAEDPALAGYVEPEMRILGWIGRPVLVLLNQTGVPDTREQRLAQEARWRAHLARHEAVRDVLSLDAFARCWVQEGVLLERIRDLLPEAQRQPLEDLIEVWQRRNRAVFRSAMEQLAILLAGAAADREPVGRGLLAPLERRRAARALARRLEARIRTTSEALIGLHGLAGEGAAEVRARLEDVSVPGERPEPWQAGVLGGLAGGALGGLAADLAAGGLSFGGGTVAGALLGALGLGGLAWAYDTLADEAEPRVTWSLEYLERATRDALLRYLAVAHFGRGGGAYRERERPEFWREAVERALAAGREARTEAWRLAQASQAAGGEAAAREWLLPGLEAAAREVLLEFHPGVERFVAAPGSRRAAAEPGA